MSLPARQLRYKAQYRTSPHQTAQHRQVHAKRCKPPPNRTSKVQPSQRRQLAKWLRQQPCPFAANVVTCKATQIQSPISCIAPPNNTTPSSPCKTLQTALSRFSIRSAVSLPSGSANSPAPSQPMWLPARQLTYKAKYRTSPHQTTQHRQVHAKRCKPHFQGSAFAAPTACQVAPPTALPLRSQCRYLQGNSHTKPNIMHRPTKQHNTVKSMQNAANRTFKIQYSQRRQFAKRLRQLPCPFAANVVTCKATHIQSPLSYIAPPNNTTPSSPCKTPSNRTSKVQLLQRRQLAKWLRQPLYHFSCDITVKETNLLQRHM